MGLRPSTASSATNQRTPNRRLGKMTATIHTARLATLRGQAVRSSHAHVRPHRRPNVRRRALRRSGHGTQRTNRGPGLQARPTLIYWTSVTRERIGPGPWSRSCRRRPRSGDGRCCRIGRGRPAVPRISLPYRSCPSSTGGAYCGTGLGCGRPDGAGASAALEWQRPAWRPSTRSPRPGIPPLSA